MAAEYGNAKTYPAATRQELIDFADRGLGGQGAVVMTMFKLMDATDAQEKATNQLNIKLYWFTVVICVLTAVLVFVGGLHFTIRFIL